MSTVWRAGFEKSSDRFLEYSVFGVVFILNIGYMIGI